MNFTKEQQNKIIDMYKKQIDIDGIIKEFNTNEHCIREMLKENQIDRQYNTFSEELYKRICKLYQGGNTQNSICYDLLVSCNGISKTLKRNGIPKRSYSENNRRFYRNQHYFDVIDTPNKAYILGMLYADGCNSISHNAIHLHLQETDYSILEAIRKELEYEGNLRLNPLHDKNPNYKNSYILCINDEYMSKQLGKLGVVNAKSLILKFPTEEQVPHNLLSHFIRGYFDGDGNIYYYNKFNKCSTQTVGTRDFCEHLSNILHNFDCKNSIKHPKQCHENTVIV